METEFIAQWEELKRWRQELMDEVNQLKSRDVLRDPVMQGLLQEKKLLEKEVRKLVEEVRNCDLDIQDRKQFIERRRKALAGDKMLQRQYAARLNRRKDSLARLKEMSTPNIIIQNEERIIWEMEADAVEVEAAVREEIAKTEKNKREAEGVLAEIHAWIATVNVYYRASKQCVSNAIHEIELRQREHRQREVEWATQDREHLEWMLTCEPGYQLDVLRRYCERFPQDTLRDIIPPAREHGVNSPKPRKVELDEKEEDKEEKVVTSPKEWKFILVGDLDDIGVELGRARAAFCENLQSALYEMGYNLNPELIYQKLVGITRMSVAQRRRMKQVRMGKFRKWKILKIARYRIFLSVSEGGGEIRFVLRPRREAYDE
jgi:hypothetical protein